MSDTPWTDKNEFSTEFHDVVISRDARELERSHNRLLEALKLAQEKLSYYSGEYQGGPHIKTVKDAMNDAIKQAIC